MSPVVFILGSIVSFDVVWLIWARRTILRLFKGPRAAIARITLTLFVVSQLIYLLYFLIDRQSRRSSAPVPISFTATVYLWSLIGLPVGLLTAGAASLARRIMRARPAPFDPNGITRRQVLATVVVAGPPLLTFGGVMRAIPQLDDCRLRQMTVPVHGLPPRLRGLRIAHASDLHIGRYTKPGSLPKMARMVNDLKADLVVFTGDLIDLSLDDLDRGIEWLRSIDPRSGLAIVEGNHDLIEDPDEFDRRMKAAGLPLMIDETILFQPRGVAVQMLGMRWGVARGDRRRASPAGFEQSLRDRLLPQRKPEAFPILLAHHPHAFDAAVQHKLPLTLSGHTHRGQLMLTDQLGFGPLFYRYWSGLYQNGNSRCVVNNGMGNWFPLRVNAPAEVIELTLVAE